MRKLLPLVFCGVLRFERLEYNRGCHASRGFFVFTAPCVKCATVCLRLVRFVGFRPRECPWSRGLMSSWVWRVRLCNTPPPPPPLFNPSPTPRYLASADRRRIVATCILPHGVHQVRQSSVCVCRRSRFFLLVGGCVRDRDTLLPPPLPYKTKSIKYGKKNNQKVANESARKDSTAPANQRDGAKKIDGPHAARGTVVVHPASALLRAVSMKVITNRSVVDYFFALSCVCACVC